MSPRQKQQVSVPLQDGRRVDLSPGLYGWAIQTGAMLAQMGEDDRAAVAVVLALTENQLVLERREREEAKKKEQAEIAKIVAGQARKGGIHRPVVIDAETLLYRFPCEECHGEKGGHFEGCSRLPPDWVQAAKSGSGTDG